MRAAVGAIESTFLRPVALCWPRDLIQELQCPRHALMCETLGAPYHPALDPRRRRERFGRRASGSPAYPAAKAKRDSSMPRKRDG